MATVFGMREELYTLITLKRVRLSLVNTMQLLQRLKHEVQIKRPHLAKKKILLHHDKFGLMPHPLYSPDLAPSD